ncbi:DedA family protein [Pseudonocardia sp. N23]|uniref:DedA family protein n=1 Tax=Pseudonocardia sp. N23 TaxID=1987376 RepID=UPI000BFB7A4C|nr:VTT domain-containing protein [Pseudonocardia sp. N23]GAY12149.1 DedA protein [Pseudonocardia sp. N23]
MDVVSICTTVLHSPWLPLALVVLIALDAPFPILPSETLLMTGYAAAFADRDLGGVALLVVAALLGCVAGDLLVHTLGRSSTALVARHVDRAGPIAQWVTTTTLRRPLVALVAARFVPSGRLVSTAIAGRVGLPVRRFVPGSLVSSSLWGVYMLVAGMLLGPVVADDPLVGLAVGAGMATVTAAAFGIYYRVRMARLRAAALREPAEAAAEYVPA